MLNFDIGILIMFGMAGIVRCDGKELFSPIHDER